MDQPKIETILEKVDIWNKDDVRYEELSGGLTNNNYTVKANGKKYVLRIPGIGSEVMIDRDLELSSSKAAAEAGVSPEVVCSVKPENALVISFIEGEVMHPETVAENDAYVEKIATSLRQLHSNAVFEEETYVFDMIPRYIQMCKEAGAFLPNDFDWMISVMDDIAEAMERDKPALTACHNDLLSENFIHDPNGKMWIIDWEYGGMNDPYFDLGDICVEHPLTVEQEEILLKTYCGEMSEGRLCRMRLHKLTADVWWGMWGMIQDKISSLDFDFYTYGIRRFERFRRNYYEGEYKKWKRRV
ncbi:MAG: phosphotransferase [Desulfobacterales bacterium]|nr:phosphotransferase [Desulfobacterales bacterium]